MQTVNWIIVTTLAGGPMAVLIAAAVSLTVLRQRASRLVAFSVGMLLAAAFLRLIPEALHEVDSYAAGAWLLAGFGVFFLLEKSLCLHRKTGDDPRSFAGIAVLAGDAIHNFCDGLLIAAAFLQDPALGFAVAAAVVAHEVPQEIGDFMVLLSCGYSRSKALLLNGLTSLASVAGGLVGWFALRGVEKAVPYVLCIAAASFIYVAIAELLPALRRGRRIGDVALQSGLIVMGVSVVVLTGHAGVEH